MLTNTERQQIVEEVNAGTYGIDEALDDIAAAQKGEEVRKALYAEALVLNREGHAGSTDMIARQKIANLQTSVNGQISTLRTEVGEDIDDLETALNSGLATQNGKIAAQNATIANVVANYNVEYGSETLWEATGETGLLASGTTATLSKDVSNFDYVDIYSFCGNINVLDTVPVDAKLQSTQGYATRWVNLSDPDSGSYKAYVRIVETRLHIIGTTLTIDHQVTYRNGEEVNISGAEITQSNRSTYVGELGIMKVVGRKITANTEVTDIRVGADGTTYNSAGAAVRAQVTALESEIPAVDSTLSTQGEAADAKVVGGRVDELKSAINNKTDVSTLGWEIGSLNSGSGTEQSSQTRIRSEYFLVSEGTKLDLSGTDDCLIVYSFDGDKGYLADTAWTIHNTFTVPSGVTYIRILIRKNTSNSTITNDEIASQYARLTITLILPQRVYALPTELDAVSDSIYGLADLTTVTVTKANAASPSWTAGGYKDANGNIQTNASYSYSDLIPVSPGDIVRSSHMRFVTAYKTETTTSYSDFKTDVTEYTVSAVTHYIVISKSNSYTSEPIYIEHTEKQNSALQKLTVLETVCNGTPGMKKTGNLANGSLGFNAFAAIRKGKTYSFYGKITAFNKLVIGCGTNTVNSASIEIDTTNVKFNNASTTINTTAHGLTFLNYVYVIVDIDGNAFPAVTIYTDGGNFTKTYADEWIGCAANVHADADASTALTDCILTFSAADVKKNIWYCGDSYMAVRDGGKLPSKLKYFGVFQNLNSIGFSGAGSENVLPDILTMFAMDLMPKYLVWAIGMNNGDTSSAVNATWKAGYDKLTELASGGNFELILATIPNTPIINNNFKNEIVRNSGYSYIDFADAVQTSQGASTWISGMLSSDNVHPTAEGAKALASRLCADFPEIFN